MNVLGSVLNELHNKLNLITSAGTTFGRNQLFKPKTIGYINNFTFN